MALLLILAPFAFFAALYLVTKSAVRDGILEARERLDSRLEPEDRISTVKCPLCGKHHDLDDPRCPHCGHRDQQPTGK